jgi:argininosuccinate lyase
MLLAAYRMADQNPLGSAAGYGTSFPINRQLTTDLLGFEQMHINVINAQMSRGKTERITAYALSTLAGTISKMAGDICLFSSQNFGFLTLPEELTTGSSIMPHKKNPDVFELIRARCNKIQALPNEIDHIWINLSPGYFRDMQVIKESFLPVFEQLVECINMASYSLARIQPASGVLDDSKYQYIFSVEEVNKLVLEGMSFREAYKAVARQIQEGTYHPDPSVQHTHEGSIGNLCNEKITVKLESLKRLFRFEQKDKACHGLLTL